MFSFLLIIQGCSMTARAFTQTGHDNPRDRLLSRRTLSPPRAILFNAIKTSNLSYYKLLEVFTN